jgi:hypothetical protein
VHRHIRRDAQRAVSGGFTQQGGSAREARSRRAAKMINVKGSKDSQASRLMAKALGGGGAFTL